MCREPALARRSRLQVQITAGQLDCLFWGTTCCPGVRALFCNLAVQVWFLILVGSGVSSILQSFSFFHQDKRFLFCGGACGQKQSSSCLWHHSGWKLKLFWHPLCFSLQLSQCCQHFDVLLKGRGGGVCPVLHPCLPPCRGKHLWSSPCPQVTFFLTCSGGSQGRGADCIHGQLLQRYFSSANVTTRSPKTLSKTWRQLIKVTFWREKLADLTSDFQASHGFFAQRTEGFLWLADQPLPGKRPGGEILFSFEILSF